MRTLAILIWLCGSATAVADGTRSVTVLPGIAELRVTANGDVDISWESRQPIDLIYKTLETKTGESAFLWCAAPGARYVLVSDVILWDERQREKTTWIVTVDGDVPQPDPDPDNPPDPPPQLTGLAKAVYDYAVLASRPQDARQFAANYRSVLSKMAAVSSYTTEDAANEIIRLNSQVVSGGVWKKLGNAIGREMNKSRDKDQLKALFAKVIEGFEASL